MLHPQLHRLLSSLGLTPERAPAADESWQAFLRALSRSFEAFGGRSSAEEALRESESRYRSVIENLKEVIFQTDREGRWTFLNPAWTEVTGFSVQETLGRDFLLFVHPDDRERHQALLRPLLSGEKEFCRHEVRYVTKTGGVRWVEVYARPTLSASGEGAGLSGTLNDVTDRRRAEEELARLAHVSQSISDFVVITDVEGRITFANRTALERFGWTEQELLGKLARVFLSRNNPPGLAGQIYRATLAGGFRGDIVNTTRDGEDLWVSLTTSLLTRDGEVYGMVSVSRDITERKQVEAELKSAKDEAEAASRAKSEFLANMSHEIRTPMNAVIGMTGLLLDTSLSPEQRDFVETIRTSGDTLLTIINDILDFSKMESGKLELERQPFDLRDVVEESFDLIAPRAAEKELDLAFHVEESVPPSIWGDVTRVRQILVNLLSNAVKFTPRGEVSLLARATPLAGSRHEVVISVTDTGIGIPEERQSRLFRAFSQGDTSTTRQFGGTGLGLVISQRLSEMMGGRIWVESAAVKGSTFHVALVAEEAPLQPKSGSFVSALHLRGQRLLVVEASPAVRRSIALPVLSWGMEPHTTASAAEALEWLDAGERFDAGILGRQVSGVDGIALAGEIRKRRSSADLPLVLLTTIGRRERDSSSTPFTATLTKPVKPNQLRSALVSLKDDSLVRARRRSKGPTVDREMGAKHPLRILVAEDNLVNQKVALSLLGRLGYRAEVAANGLEVLEALSRQSYDLVLMDVQMPEMDGLEAARQIHGNAGSAPVPRIVAMTANAMKGDRDACLAAGMDDYVSKPVEIVELQAALARTPRREAFPEAGDGSGPSEREPRGTLLDATALQKLRQLQEAGEPDFLTSLIDLFFRDTPVRLGELRRSAAGGDALAFRRVVHGLKASAGTLGGVRMASISARMESLAEPGTLPEAARLLPVLEAEFAALCRALSPERR